MGHMPLVMIRFRNAVVVLASLVSAGICIYVGRLLYERLVIHVPDAAMFFSVSHSDWAFVFLVALLCTVIGPVVLIVVCAYAWMDPDRRAMWVAFVVILLTGLIVADAPASVWHRFAPA